MLDNRELPGAPEARRPSRGLVALGLDICKWEPWVWRSESGVGVYSGLGSRIGSADLGLSVVSIGPEGPGGLCLGLGVRASPSLVLEALASAQSQHPWL